MLTREEAQQLVLARLNKKNRRDLSILEDRTVERPFGWLFFVATAGTDTSPQSETISQRLIVVNKYVEQVVESSVDYTPERFIKIYESLLAKSRASSENWCLTGSFPLPWRGFARRRLAKKAREMGLYEIR